MNGIYEKIGVVEGQPQFEKDGWKLTYRTHSAQIRWKITNPSDKTLASYTDLQRDGLLPSSGFAESCTGEAPWTNASSIRVSSSLSTTASR